jgi:hypothetical protein
MPVKTRMGVITENHPADNAVLRREGDADE